MPCDSVQTTTVEFMKADLLVLAKAMRSAGWQLRTATADAINAYKDGATFDLRKGQTRATVSTRSYSSSADQITTEVKKAYGKQVVQVAMDRFGYKAKSTNGNKVVYGRK